MVQARQARRDGGMKGGLFVAASLLGLGTTSCGPVKAKLTESLHGMLGIVEPLNHGLIGTRGMAKLYTEADVDREFRVNGLDTPSDTRYAGLRRGNFAGY